MATLGSHVRAESSQWPSGFPPATQEEKRIMNRIAISSCAALACAVPALAGVAGQSASYGWENGATVLGQSSSNIAFTNSTDNPLSGTASLFMNEDPLSGTPQGYVAFITGLSDGDVIDASFWAFDDTPGASPSVRIWGHYAQSGDVDDAAGSAGGNSTYSGEDGDWSELFHSWTFDSNGGTRDALVIEVRMYASSSNGSSAYIDDLTVATTSDTAVINFAPAPGALALLGLAGVAGRRRRG